MGRAGWGGRRGRARRAWEGGGLVFVISSEEGVWLDAPQDELTACGWVWVGWFGRRGRAAWAGLVFWCL